jgi:thioredoxin-like negative regulator of GroEL
MTPIVDGLEDRYGERLKFVRLDLDDTVQGQEARTLGVNAHPAFMLITGNGEVVARFAGEIARTKLEAAIMQLLKVSAGT